jgi:hypothetical protein
VVYEPLVKHAGEAGFFSTSFDELRVLGTQTHSYTALVKRTLTYIADPAL